MITGSTRRIAHTIVGRWLAGECVDDIAYDYNLWAWAVSLIIATAADTTATRRKKVLEKLETDA